MKQNAVDKFIVYLIHQTWEKGWDSLSKEQLEFLINHSSDNKKLAERAKEELKEKK